MELTVSRAQGLAAAMLLASFPGAALAQAQAPEPETEWTWIAAPTCGPRTWLSICPSPAIRSGPLLGLVFRF